MNNPAKRTRPISRDVFAILVALAHGEQTGSEIQSRIIGDTVGVYVRASSIYTALHRLKEIGLVEARSKAYRLTDKGWHELKVETRTFEGLVQHSKRRVVDAGHGRW
jgi:DNA-binding PadR family transcriptional regulator